MTALSSAPVFRPRGFPVLIFLLCTLAAVTGAAQKAQPIVPNLGISATSGYLVTPSYIRSGVPVTFSARALPADATGTLTFAVDSVPVQTSTIGPQTPGDFVAVGDSITAAIYIGDPAQRFPAVVGSALNLNTTIVASPGYTACDAMYLNMIPDNVGAIATVNPLYSVMLGANDYNLYGNGAHEAVFNLCDRAVITWVGVPRRNKTLIGDPGVGVVNGSWSATQVSCCLSTLGLSSGTGDVRFSLTTTGAPAYLWYGIQTATAGSFTVSIDGGPPSAVTQTQFSGSAETLPAAYALLRLPVAAGAHTFDIAALGGTVTLLGMGTPPPAAAGSVPTVLVTDIPYGLNSNNATAQYTADIQANLTLLQPDGLDLRFVPTHQFMFGTPAEMMDARHPNALGLSELAQALLSVVTPANPASDSTSVAAATFTTSTLGVGGHEIAVFYSGDTRYAPASAAIIGFVLYDATSSTTLTASATLISPQTPVTLTGAVANADGLMKFVDTSSGGNVLLGSVWMASAPSVSITVPSLSPGQHTIVAEYDGDAVNAPSSSAPLTITVTGANSSTTLSAPATRYDAGATVPLTATVSPAYSTGSVSFLDGATVLGQAPLVSGTASFSTSTLAPGVHSLTASYNGNGTDNSSTSPALAIEIDPNPTTVAIAPVPASVTYGTPVALTVTVSPASASGSVALSDSFVALNQTGSVTQSIALPALSSGTASITSGSLAPGNHTLTATYAGDTNDLPAVSSAVAIRVTLAPSSTTLAPIPANLAYGNALTLTASVTPAASTGTVTFTDSVSGVLAQLPLTDGTASFSSSTLPPGAHSVTASYSGDSFRAASSSAAVSTAISPAVSSVALAASAATVYAGSPLTLTATVNPASATGTVVFRDATFGVLGQSPIAKGVATLTLASPAIGAYSITASYSGDLDDTASISAAVTAQVALTPTTTVLTASPNPAGFGASISLAASVSPSSATGSIVFMDGSATLGTAILNAGKASFASSTLAVGSHSLRAVYSGDSLNATSTSAALAETVSASATTTSLTLAQTAVTANAMATVNVRIASTGTTPSGTVTLRSGGTVLATGTVANAAPGAGYATLSFSAGRLGLGSFPLIAAYSGDADDLASDSSAAPVSLMVNGIPTSASLSLSTAQTAIEGSITLSAMVTAAAGTPTGSVAFSSNGTSLGTAALGANGTATLPLNATALGSLPIVATYTPTGLYAAAVSAPQTLLVTAPLTDALSPATLQAGPGSSTTATLLLTPLSGFTGAIQTTCATSASFVQCSVSAPAAMTGPAPVSVPVEITIAKTSAAVSRAPGAAFALLLPALLAFRSRRRLRGSLRVLSAIAVLAAASLLVAGCAADGGNFNSVPAGAQTVTLTVTAAGMPIATTLTVNVAD
jgi:hypothetical protein